ncbi:hypothetical protein [Neobacillus sp. Marseille-QA0830]
MYVPPVCNFTASLIKLVVCLFTRYGGGQAFITKNLSKELKADLSNNQDNNKVSRVKRTLFLGQNARTQQAKKCRNAPDELLSPK